MSGWDHKRGLNHLETFPPGATLEDDTMRLPTDNLSHSVRASRRRVVSAAWTLITLGCLLTAPGVAGATQGPGSGSDNKRKAIMMGASVPEGETDPVATHAQRARMTFLRLVGNLENDPAKGWTCDMEWDLKVRLGMNPTNTSAEMLFNYIGRHRLGYRIAMNCGPMGQTADYWRCAVDNGIMPFAPHYNNNPGLRFDDPNGIRSAVSVAGGRTVNVGSYGQSLEFIEAVPEWGPHPENEDTAQSWANQGLAAKFARILDAHPGYNIWDARQHLRQAASFWPTGWTETNGYGRVNERAVVGRLLPGPPVEFQAAKSRDRHRVLFSWHNFLQTDFAATVIARRDGRVIYEGAGTNFVWDSDVDGAETFSYWSKNRAGEVSRMESCQNRTLTGLNCGPYQTCLVLGPRPGDEGLTRTLCERFQQVATNWVCDLISRPMPGYANPHTPAPTDPVVAVLPDFSAMVSYAITNHYRLLIAPAVYPETDLYGFRKDWDRAAGAGILVVVPHHSSPSSSRRPQARRLSPPRLFSAITVGEGTTTNRLSFGPGLEFFDTPAEAGRGPIGLTNQLDAAGVIAGKLGRILDANPDYNSWDARQHLRQSASHYATGWVEDGGYGRPPAHPARIAVLHPAPPLEIQAIQSAAGDSVAFSWQNFRQSSFAETVIQRKDGRTLYHGAGTTFTWRSDVSGDETFRFYSKDRTGRLSRSEAYTILRVEGLRRTQATDKTAG